MNKYILLLLLVLVFVLMTQKEGYKEMFGFSGHKKEANYLVINDTLTNISDYQEVPVKVGPHHLQTIILNANRYITEKIDDCAYIIETSDIKQYKGSATYQQIVRAMFMCVRNKGYTYGFAVTVDAEYDTAKILCVRTQPLGIDAPSDVSAYTSDGVTQNFTKYETIKKSTLLTRGDFEEILPDPRPTSA